MTNMKDKNDTAYESIRRTENKTVHGEGGIATYALYELKVSSRGSYYAVSIETESDDAFAAIGKNEREAMALYGKIAELEAMPCTLNDIVSDYHRENQY